MTAQEKLRAGESKFSSHDETIKLIIVRGEAVDMMSNLGAGGGGIEGGGFAGGIVVWRDRGVVLGGGESDLNKGS
jgi:hypothetical protein